MALEKQPSANWKDRIAGETNPTIASAALIALLATGFLRADEKSELLLGRVDKMEKCPELFGFLE